jgi:uncharacterized protein (DUF1501 family)
MKRRTFIANAGLSGLALASFPGLINSISVQALADTGSPLAQLLEATDRILVVIQMSGGNDGLNTVIPHTDPVYVSSRPNLRIASNKVLPISNTLGWHPALTGFRDLYENGELVIVQGVTYPNPDRSHFRGTDIWLTATDADVFAGTGWMGRYLETLAPDYPETLPPHPLAIQIGSSVSLGLLGAKGPMGITFRDPDEFYRLVNTGARDEVPAGSSDDTPAGREIEFMRNIARSADTYAKVVKESADAGSTTTQYPNTDLGARLKVVSQLISGGLNSRIYLVSWAGNNFDTHADQGADTGAHQRLLSELSGAVSSFMQDMKAQGHANRITGMTFSEFGRRVAENGSRGTDHGTAAPLFAFGTMVDGGKIIGTDPDLTQLDDRGDLLMQHDYRDLYASMLLQWFGMNASAAQNVLFRDFSATTLPIFKGIVPVKEDPRAPLRSIGITPNPAVTTATIRVDTLGGRTAAIEVHDLHGRLVRTASTDHDVQIDVSTLSPGTYVVTAKLERSMSRAVLRVQR